MQARRALPRGLPRPAHADVIGDDKKHRSRHPGCRIRGTDARKTPDPDEHKRRDDARRKLRHSGKSGDKTLADALQRIAVDVDGPEEEIEGTLPQKIFPAVGDHLIVMRGDVGAQVGIEEEAHERLAQRHIEHEAYAHADKAVQHAHFHALADAPVLARPVVLPRIRRHCGAERNERLRGNAVDLGSGSVRRDYPGQRSIQSVERRLLHHAADRRNGKLQRHGKSLRKMPARQAEIPSEVGAAGAQQRIAAQRKDQAADARDELRKHGGERRARIVHAEREDEQKVQPDIEQRRKDEEEQGRARIPHRPQHARNDVVKSSRRNAAEDDEQITVGILVIGGGRVHQIEQNARERHRDRRDHGGDQGAQKIAHAHGAAHAVLIARAERLRHLDGKTRRQPVHRPDDQKDDGARQSHARKCLGPDGIPHNDGIRHVIELLKHAAQKHGERKKENEFERTALCQILHALCLFHSPCLRRARTSRRSDIFLFHFSPPVLYAFSTKRQVFFHIILCAVAKISGEKYKRAHFV